MSGSCGSWVDEANPAYGPARLRGLQTVQAVVGHPAAVVGAAHRIDDLGDVAAVVVAVLMAEHPARVGAGGRQLARVLRQRVDDAVAVGIPSYKLG